MSAILYYITDHGYGHAVRSSQVIRSLKAARSGIDIFVRTTAPRWLFDGALPRDRYFPGSIDVGMIQRDSLAMEPRETVKACQTLHDRAAVLVEQQTGFIRKHQVQLIVADIPPLAFEIAARASIPSVAVSNFTWDFIYRAYGDRYPEFLPLAAEMERHYAKATLALTLPYPCEMTAFQRREAIPWITRVSPLTKEEATKKFALPESAPIVLLSFGGLGLDRLAWPAIKRQKEFFFVTTGGAKRADGNVLILPSAQSHYEDLVRASDIIVTKPGYGIVADTLAHRVPLLYTDRGDFPEYPRFVQALNECATALYIPQNDLLAGHLSPYINQLLQSEANWPAVDSDGAEKAAQKIIALLDG
jgi:Glycosyl transferase family 1